MKRLMPAEGLIVPQEDGSSWPAEGVPLPPGGVPETLYLRRRLADGDVVVVDGKQAAAELAAAAGEPAAEEAPADAGTKPRRGGTL